MIPRVPLEPPQPGVVRSKTKRIPTMLERESTA